MGDSAIDSDWAAIDLRFPPPDELLEAARTGGRLVHYETCISLLFLSLRQPSRVHVVPPGGHGFWAGVPYSLVTLLLGWWGLPWGVVLTPRILYLNCTGGRDVTAQGLAFLQEGERPVGGATIDG